MGISYIEAVLLHCLNQINDERSIYSLYHLFQGKKSSQTIQDAHLFELTALFQAFPFLSRTDIEKITEKLSDRALIYETANEHYRLTKEGSEELEQFRQRNVVPPKYIAGWEYHHLTAVFWERLSLLVQVCSNLVHLKKGFIPVQNKQETLEWLKSFLQEQSIDRYELAINLYRELEFCLEQDKNINPSALILRLTGYAKIGLTSKQAAEMLRMDEPEYHLEFLNTLHYLIWKLPRSTFCPLLRKLVGSEEKTIPFTRSTEKTYELLKKGYSLTEIARIRHLKKNTIEDHIVEIALHIKDFNLNPYVQPEKAERIVEAAREMSTRKLREIREKVDDANYFEIRLVLARNGGRQWN